jgi:dihydroneopterin aldolase
MSPGDATGDRLRLLGLRLDLRIGVTEAERARPQAIELDLELALPLQAAGEGDDLRATVDYATVVEALRSALEGRAFHLLEAVAERAARAALADPRVRGVVVRARKRDPPVKGSLAASEVEVHRSAT